MVSGREGTVPGLEDTTLITPEVWMTVRRRLWSMAAPSSCLASDGIGGARWMVIRCLGVFRQRSLPEMRLKPIQPVVVDASDIHPGCTERDNTPRARENHGSQ